MDFIITNFELLFYYIPFAAMLLIYFVITMDEFANDLAARSDALGMESEYRPKLTIGMILRRMFIATFPVLNIAALVLAIIRSNLVKDWVTEVLMRIFDFIDSPVVAPHDKIYFEIKRNFGDQGEYTTSPKLFKIKGIGEIEVCVVYEGAFDSENSLIKHAAVAQDDYPAEALPKVVELTKLLVGRTLSEWRELPLQFNLAMVKRVLAGDAAEPPRKPRTPKVAPVTTEGGNNNTAEEL